MHTTDRVRRLTAAVLLLVAFLAVQTGAVLAQPYTYLGRFAVEDGPSWNNNPRCLSARDIAAVLYGGSPADYAISTNGPDPAHVNRLAWVDGWGDTRYFTNPASEDFKRGTFYNEQGTPGSTYSAWVLDHGGSHHYNYVFRTSPLPPLPPCTYVGRFAVEDGPDWHTSPPCVSARAQAALLFGGVPSDYLISTNGPDPAQVNRRAWVDGLADDSFLRTPVHQDFVFGTRYFEGTHAGTAYSAWVLDHGSGGHYNYVFRITAPLEVSEVKLGLPKFAPPGTYYLGVKLYARGSGSGRITGTWVVQPGRATPFDRPISLSSGGWTEVMELQIPRNEAIGHHTIQANVQSPQVLSTSQIQADVTGFLPEQHGWHFENFTLFGAPGFCAGMSVRARYLYYNPPMPDIDVPTLGLVRILGWTHVRAGDYWDRHDKGRIANKPVSWILYSETNRILARLAAGDPTVVYLKPLDLGATGHTIVAVASFACTDAYIATDTPYIAPHAVMFATYDPNHRHEYGVMAVIEQAGQYSLWGYPDFPIISEYTGQ